MTAGGHTIELMFAILKNFVGERCQENASPEVSSSAVLYNLSGADPNSKLLFLHSYFMVAIIKRVQVNLRSKQEVSAANLALKYFDVALIVSIIQNDTVNHLWRRLCDLPLL